jgi:hypothetical protein
MNLLVTAFKIITFHWLIGFMLNRIINIKSRFILSSIIYDIVTSMGITTLIAVYSSLFGLFPHIQLISFVTLLTIFFVYIYTILIKQNNKFLIRKNYKNIYYILYFVFFISISYLAISENIYSEDTFINLDPWTVRPAVKDIITNNKSFLDNQLGNYNLGFYKGFYYWIALHFQIGSLNVIRFLGWISFLLSVLLIFSIGMEFGEPEIMLIPISLLIPNPRILTRFSMAIREPFAYVFLIYLLVLFIKYEKQKNQNNKLLFLLSITLSVIALSHSLTLIFAVGSLVFYFIYLLISNKKATKIVLLASVVISTIPLSLGGVLRPLKIAIKLFL